MRSRHLMTSLLVACALACGPFSADAASISRTYSYYAIDGKTLDEIQEQLVVRGPHVGSTGRRHPGATQMEFTTRLGYAEGARNCRIAKATVGVDAKIILPRWRRRQGAGEDVRMIWDTLSADIKRHEESHTVIARTHARELEQALLAIPPKKTCALAAAEARAVTERIMKKHDAAQARFDRVELVNFERRFLRLMQYRLERTERGRTGR